jgi:hypothetical protein
MTADVGISSNRGRALGKRTRGRAQRRTCARRASSIGGAAALASDGLAAVPAPSAVAAAARWAQRVKRGRKETAPAGFRVEAGKAASDGPGLRDAASIAIAVAAGGGGGVDLMGGKEGNEWACRVWQGMDGRTHPPAELSAKMPAWLVLTGDTYAENIWISTKIPLSTKETRSNITSGHSEAWNSPSRPSAIDK